MPMQREDEKVANLAGSPQNPSRDPKRRRPLQGSGSMGDQAFIDAMCILGGCLLIVLLIGFSLRNHNL